MIDTITFVDQEGKTHELTMESQGAAQPASEADLARDEHGYTNPYLHRRIDPQDPPAGSEEVAPREYKLLIGDKNSYRMTKKEVHDEDSETCEIP